MLNDRISALAEEMFNAYNAEGPNPGLAHDGKPVPKWNEIAPEKRGQIQGKWKAAARKAVHMITEEMRMSFMRHCDAAASDARDGIRLGYDVKGAPAITHSGNTG